MARMKNRKLAEEKIDEIVTKEAEDLTRWEAPILVKPAGVGSIRLSLETIRKAKHLAKLHKLRGYQAWLKQIIEERIQLEEDILTELKQEFRKGSSR